MLHVYIIGLGSLGSTVATEIAKRSLATKTIVRMSLYDYDTVEERNVAAQIFTPEHIGKTKAEVVGGIVNQYSTVEAKVYNEKIGPPEIARLAKEMEVSEDNIVILDCVDNLPTRELLWTLGGLSSNPVLHVSMSTKGMGYAQWSVQLLELDTWSLSPKNIRPETREAIINEDKPVVPPCELNSMRTLILLTSLAAVNAIFLVEGKDPSNFLGEDTSKYGAIFSTWKTDLNSMSIVKELTYCL